MARLPLCGEKRVWDIHLHELTHTHNINQLNTRTTTQHDPGSRASGDLAANKTQPKQTQREEGRGFRVFMEKGEPAQTQAEGEEMQEVQKGASQFWPPYSEMECQGKGLRCRALDNMEPGPNRQHLRAEKIILKQG